MKKNWIFLAIAVVLAIPSSQAAQKKWVGTWAASPQQPLPGSVRTFNNETVRLIVHTSVDGAPARVKISNVFGKSPLKVGAAHIALRTKEADIDPASDRTLKFHGKTGVTVPAGKSAISDPVDLNIPALSDVAISLFFPEKTDVTTLHVMSKQTNYLSSAAGDSTGAAQFAVSKKFRSWPFVVGLDVERSGATASIVAFGSSLTDGDGSTTDANKRLPDILAERLQKAHIELGVLNEGIIGNRLLSDYPSDPNFRFGAAVGEAGMKRFDRDVLAQPGVKYVIMGLGVNDILYPGDFTPADQSVSAKDLITAYRQLIRAAHRHGIKMIGTTLSPFEDSFFEDPPLKFYTPAKEAVRLEVNKWILTGNEFDGVVDIDSVVRDPNRPSHFLAQYDSGDHLHPNDAGYVEQANLFPLALFR